LTAAAIHSHPPRHHQAPIIHTCGHTLYDGQMIRSRCVNVRDGTALCRCKQWVAVPIKPA